MRALFLQEIKTFFKSPSSIFIFVIPLILLVGLGYFIPAAYIIPSTISVGIVGAVLLYFGGGLEEIKRTSFLKVMGTTKLNKVTTLIVKMFFASIVAMVTVIWVLGLGYLFSEVIPFLAVDFGHLSPDLGIIPGAVHWDKVQWFILFYAAALSLCVTLALAFCFAAIAKSSLSFYLLTFGYIAALILFGGVIMPGFLLVGNEWFHWFYYLIPNYYSGNQLTAAFNSGLSKEVFFILGALQTILDFVANYALDTYFPNFLFNHPDFGPTGVILALQQWVENNPGFVQMWNDMAAAVNAAGDDLSNGNVDFSGVDGGEHRDVIKLWDWSSTRLSAWLALLALNISNNGLKTVLGNFAENTFMGTYKIDDIVYLLLTIPSESTVGILINEGTIKVGVGPLAFDKEVWDGLEKTTGASLDELLGGVIKGVNEVVNILNSGTVKTVKALIGSMEYSKAFDFTNTKSIIDVFMPYAWIAFLAAISAWKFEWVN